MVYPDSAMARCHPSSDKENLVPRAQRSEPGSVGLVSTRNRGLMNSEQRLHTVLKESSLQNQTPAAVTSGKTNLGPAEKEWLKISTTDYSSGKQSVRSLERLKEKIGQLTSGSALKPVAHKTIFDQHAVGELHSRGLSPNVSEAAVHVYRDDIVAKSGGIAWESLKAESQRRKREITTRSISSPTREESPVEQDANDRGKHISLSTPTKSPAGKDNGSSMHGHGSSLSRGTLYKKNIPGSDFLDNSRRADQSTSDGGGHFSSEKQSVSNSLVEAKSAMVQDLPGKHSLAGESLRVTSPRDEEANSSRDHSAERYALPGSTFMDKMMKRAKFSSHAPALRVRRDDPRAYSKADRSPDSENSGNDERKSPEAYHASKMAGSHANIESATPMPMISESRIFPSSKSNQSGIHKESCQTFDDILNEHRKRKAETDPSTTETSPLPSGVGNDMHFSNAFAMEAHEGVYKGGNWVQRQREGNAEKENRAEPTALEQSEERCTEDGAGQPLTGSSTNDTPGREREPWARKTVRDLRAPTLPSPTSHEYSRSGKVIGGVPPRYVPPILEPRERKAEENTSPASDGLKHYSALQKHMNETERSELNSGVLPHSNHDVKGFAPADDNAVHHLSNTFSTISIEEKNAAASHGADKSTMQGKTQTHVSGHQVNSVPAESGSNTGVTGVTAITGLTSPGVAIPHKSVVGSLQGIELQHRSHNQHPPKEWDRGIDMADRNFHPKSTGRSAVAAAEAPAHDAHDGHSGKASDPSKDRGEKNQELSHHNAAQAPRKIRTEIENERFVYVNGVRYQKLGKIGKGGSSEVFKVIATDCSIYALKRINLKGRDWTTAQEFYQEIKYLKALRGKRHIIQLFDSEVTNKKVLEKRSPSGDITEEACIYMVLEYGEIDLAGMVSAKRKEMQSYSDTDLDENWLRFYWQQILKAVRTIHDERIVHSDLKPANFMLVRGELKLIDFGIAKAIQNDTTNIVKENQTGTLNYMSPEAFLQGQTAEDGSEIKIGRASDIWSLGCIFYQMVYGQTPFAELSLYSKIQAITNPHHKIHYPRVSNPWLLDIIRRCLTWDRRKRLRIPELLEHPFLRPHIAPYCSRCEHLSVIPGKVQE